MRCSKNNIINERLLKIIRVNNNWTSVAKSCSNARKEAMDFFVRELCLLHAKPFPFLHCQLHPPALEFFQFMSEYKVQFEVFEGPLDLLLYLIKQEEVD